MALRRRGSRTYLAVATIVVLALATVLLHSRRYVEVKERGTLDISTSDSPAHDLSPSIIAVRASRSRDDEVSPNHDSESISRDASAPRSALDPPIVRFQVFDPNGAPATQGMIRAVRGVWPSASPLRHDASGRQWDVTCHEASLPVDRWTFQALAASDELRSEELPGGTINDLLSEKVTIDTNLGDEPRDVLLQLAHHPAIYGVVQGKPSKALVSVFCWPIAIGAELDEEHLWAGESLRSMRRTDFDPDLDNLFKFENLRPGRYAIAAGAIGRTSSPRMAVIAGRCERIDVAALTGVQPGDVFVRLHGPGGTESGTTSFVVATPGNARRVRNFGFVRREGDGRYWLKLGRIRLVDSNSSNDRGDRLVLTVESDKWGTRNVELREDQQEVDVYFETPAILDLTLVHFDKEAMSAGVAVACADRVEFEGLRSCRWVRSEQPDASGHSTLAGLQPGRCEVELCWCPQRGGPRSVLSRTLIEVVSGWNHAELDLPAFHELSVTWNPSSVGKPVVVRATCIDHQDWTASCDDYALERVRFHYLPAGTYDVTVKGPLREVTRRVKLDRATTLDIFE